MATAYVLADSDVPQFTDYSKINQGPPDVSYRNREFRAYLSNDELRKRLKISQYSSFENPTGIFFSNGETASLNVKGGEGKKISLIVHDFGMSGSHDVYPLNEGSNVHRYISPLTEGRSTVCSLLKTTRKHGRDCSPPLSAVSSTSWGRAVS